MGGEGADRVGERGGGGLCRGFEDVQAFGEFVEVLFEGGVGEGEFFEGVLVVVDGGGGGSGGGAGLGEEGE